jgi:hypothetical protein
MAAVVSTQDDIKDVLLTEVAVQIQLPPSLYQLAIKRVETLAVWLDRPGSALAGRVTVVYPQGSMAIHATIASCLERDEFDIDVIVQLSTTGFASAKVVLDALYQSIRGEPGSRYFDITSRNTRCVTVQYADMHVDLTPAEIIPQRSPRVSDIFHHRPESLELPGKRITANPFGFAEWFNSSATRFAQFEQAFGRQSLAMDRLLAKAATEDVPEQLSAYLKPPAVVALQLVKRFRNVRYEGRKGRRPPGVLLAAIIADSSSRTGNLFDELLFQVRKLRQRFADAQRYGSLLSVVNPTCPEDCFTDRWPANLTEQQVFLGDLNFFVEVLERIQYNADLEAIQGAFARLFGEQVSQRVVKSFADRSGERIASGNLLTEGSTGRADLRSSRLVSAVAAAGTSTTRAAPRHTFYGSD